MADRLDKLENAVKKLASDMAELRSEMSEVKDDLSEFKADMTEFKADMTEFKADMTEFKADMTEFQDDTKTALTNIARTQTALTSAVTQAIKELGVSRTFDVRLSRLEAEVFGSKH